MGLKAFVIAGEPSGDKLGGALMSGLKSLTDCQFDGIGGPSMEAQGLASRFPMSELSVMGLAEILPKYRSLKARVVEMAEAVLETQPDVLITIDSPEFCLRVAKLVKAKNDIKTVHYVAPTVWAWRAGRAEKMSAYIDHVLALFPFEPPLMKEAGMGCDFVGHPVVAEPVAKEAEAEVFRTAHGLEGTIILALPGSRKSEVSRLADRFGAALSDVTSTVPEARVVVPCAEPSYETAKQMTKDWPGQPLLLPPGSPEKAAAFKAADVALAASGTVSLELAAAGTPMVIAYDMAWLSRLIIGRMLKIDTVTLVNLVAESRTVPEFIGTKCVPEDIAAALRATLDDPTRQQKAMRLTMERLGAGGEDPGLRAAKSVLSALAV